MSKIDMSAERKYMVNNDWLDRYTDDADRYVDLIEIAKTPQNSQYLRDLRAMGVDVDDGVESQRASFMINGLRAGDDDGGTQIDGVLLNEHPTIERFQNNYAALVNHPERFRRFYAQGTQVRNLMWVGLGTTPRIYNT